MEPWVAALSDAARAALRPVGGDLALPGFPGDARITTDRWGVPHVDASDRDALYAAQGYLHATERLWQVEFTRRLAEGRLAELVGEPGYLIDRFFRTVGLGRIARAWTAAGIDADTTRIGSAYHAGFLAGARSLPSPVEFQILAAEPEVPERLEDAVEHSIATALLVGFGLAANWPTELLRFELAAVLGPERAAALTPFLGISPPAAVPARRNDRGAIWDLLATARHGGAGVPGTGSNNWVLAGSRTTTGAPLLCNDPHLLAQMPSIWMEMHLRCPDLDVAGVSIPGTPGIVIGHNDRIAWGFTNTQGDITDLYLERLSADGTRYEHDGVWHPLEIVREEIAVRNEPAPRVHEVRLTRHGPLLTDLLVGNVDPHVRENAVAEPLALRWIQTEVPVRLRPVEMLNEARDWESFRAAAALWPITGQNMVYADVDGHIGYQCTGVYPVRAKGSGSAPVPGWDPAYEWTGVIPFDGLPWALDPPGGVIATANNRIVDVDYPHYITNDWEPPHRIARIDLLLASRERHSPDDLAATQLDTRSGLADALIPAALDGVRSGGAAVGLLRAWDRRMDASSAGAALFATWLDELAKALFHTELGEIAFDLYHTNRSWVSAFSSETTIASIARHPSRDRLVAETLDAAWRALAARLGDDPAAWRWGALHEITFAHPLARALPPLAELLNVGPMEAPGGDDTVNRGTYAVGENFQAAGIPSYRQIIDLGDFDRSRSVITTGCSGNPASPYYANQAPLWVAGQYHGTPFSARAIARESVGILTLKGA